MSSSSPPTASTGSSCSTPATSRNGNGCWRPTPPDGGRVSPGNLLAVLADYFGSAAAAIDFMRMFASQVMHMPTMDVVRRLEVEHHIVRRIEEDDSTESVRRLSQFHALPMRTVTKAYQKATGRTIQSLRQGVAAGTIALKTVRRRGAMLPHKVKDCSGQMGLFT